MLPGVRATAAVAAAAVAVLSSIRDGAETDRFAAVGVMGADVEAVSYVEARDLGLWPSSDVLE